MLASVLHPVLAARRLTTVAVGALVGLGLFVTQSTPSPEPPELAPVHEARSAVRVHVTDDASRERALEIAQDVWSDRAPDHVVIVVDASGRAQLHAEGLEYEVEVPDIDAVAAQEKTRLQSLDVSKPADFLADYRPYEDVDAYLGHLADLAGERATVLALGTSVEGRPIRGLRLRLGDRVGDRDAEDAAATEAPLLVVNGGQHAREWISVMTAICIADRLVRQPAALSEARDWIIVPIVNPDGYAYAWERDRYWRKNRRGGHGVDLNRNWDWAWGERGSSNNRRSQIYAGQSAFSEPETRAMRDLLVAERPAAHVDLHSYSQLVLYPWNHAKTDAPDRPRLQRYAEAMSQAIADTHGEVYRPISGAQLYPASGTFSDWAYGRLGVSSFVFELRPKKGSGFVLPPEEIRPTCDETFAALSRLAELVEDDAPQQMLP